MEEISYSSRALKNTINQSIKGTNAHESTVEPYLGNKIPTIGNLNPQSFIPVLKI